LLCLFALVGTAGCGYSSAANRALYDQSWRQLHAGDLDAALRLASTGLSHNPKSDAEWHWKFLVLESEILMRQGNYEASLFRLQHELPAQFSRSDSAVWRKLTQSSSLTYLSRTSEAASSLAQAESLASAAQPQLLGEVLLRRGTLASVQHDLPAAHSLFRSSLQFAADHSDAFLQASSLGALAVNSERMEHHDESIDWNKQALKLIRDHSWRSLASKVEGNLAWSYSQLGDYERALDEYRAAEKLAVAAALQHEKVLWMISIADTEYELGDYQSARSDARQALQLAEKLGDPADKINCLQDSARIAIQNGRFPEAQAQLQEAAGLIAGSPDVQSDLYNRLLTAHLQFQTRDFASAAAAYASIAANSSAPVSFRWEAQASLAQAHASLGQNALADREFRNAIAIFQDARRQIPENERLAFLATAIRFYDAYVNFLIDQRRPDDALRIADLTRARTLEDGLSMSDQSSDAPPARSLAPRAIAARLRATLLFFWTGEQKSWLWAITPSSTTLVPLPSHRALRTMVDSYRSSFVDDPKDPLEMPQSDGRNLFAALLQPVQKLIPPDGRVFILSDGSLALLNFESLIVPACDSHCGSSSTSRPAHYWIDDVILSSASSLSLLARSTPRPLPPDPNILLVGNPLLASPEYPPLPQAAREMDLIPRHFPENRRFLLAGQKATASQYLNSHPEDFSLLHFTAHGTSSRLQPLESAVILSPDGDSYKLYAHDILQHPLSAYLVTVSACNGAGTKTYAGEGLVGLSWSFLRAGSHNVIAGLWEVSASSTPQLMDQLYQNILAGQDPAAALRNAKLTLVHSPGNYRRPFYWAPLVLYSGS